MTEQAIPGPPCEGCGQEYAIMSLMNYADYSQMRLGPDCGPQYLRMVADSIDGRTTAEPDAAAIPDPELTDAVPTPEQQAAGAAAAQADDEPGSARDHWASTTHVRRSTHGHRRTSSATGKPREGDDT